MFGLHPIIHWSKTQLVVAMSSGEAELNAVLKGSSEGLGVATMMSELDFHMKVKVKTDSSACVGMTHRQGVGRIKHLEVKSLWIQEAVKAGKVKVEKLPRLSNFSDVLTHHWTKAEGDLHLSKLGEWRDFDSVVK